MKKCQLLPQLFWSSKYTLSILCDVLQTHKRNTLIIMTRLWCQTSLPVSTIYSGRTAIINLGCDHQPNIILVNRLTINIVLTFPFRSFS